MLQVRVPVPLSGNDLPWGLMFKVPRDGVMARAKVLDQQLRAANAETATKVILIGIMIPL